MKQFGEKNKTTFMSMWNKIYTFIKRLYKELLSVVAKCRRFKIKKSHYIVWLFLTFLLGPLLLGVAVVIFFYYKHFIFFFCIFSLLLPILFTGLWWCNLVGETKNVFFHLRILIVLIYNELYIFFHKLTLFITLVSIAFRIQIIISIIICLPLIGQVLTLLDSFPRCIYIIYLYSFISLFYILFFCIVWLSSNVNIDLEDEDEEEAQKERDEMFERGYNARYQERRKELDRLLDLQREREYAKWFAEANVQVRKELSFNLEDPESEVSKSECEYPFDKLLDECLDEGFDKIDQLLDLERQKKLNEKYDSFFHQD